MEQAETESRMGQGRHKHRTGKDRKDIETKGDISLNRERNREDKKNYNRDMNASSKKKVCQRLGIDNKKQEGNLSDSLACRSKGQVEVESRMFLTNS
jgi:hypothetical protein